MPHCSHCYFSEKLCLCSKPEAKIKLPFRLIFVMNKSEFFRLSNSARLFLLQSYPCEIRVRGLRHSPFSYENFFDEIKKDRNFLLYPHRDAKPTHLEDEISQIKGPINLIIPDGNWAQAAKIAYKLRQSPFVQNISLKEPPKSSYRLRLNPNSERISTFEASLYAIKNLLREEEKKNLELVFENFVENVLKLRGKVSDKKI